MPCSHNELRRGSQILGQQASDIFGKEGETSRTVLFVTNESFTFEISLLHQDRALLTALNESGFTYLPALKAMIYPCFKNDVINHLRFWLRQPTAADLPT